MILSNNGSPGIGKHAGSVERGGGRAPQKLRFFGRFAPHASTQTNDCHIDPALESMRARLSGEVAEHLKNYVFSVASLLVQAHKQMIAMQARHWKACMPG